MIFSASLHFTPIFHLNIQPQSWHTEMIVPPTKANVYKLYETCQKQQYYSVLQILYLSKY